MTEVFARKERYGSLSSSVLYESEFEQIVANDADVLFPKFFFVPFKAPVQSPFGTRKADYALIDKSYGRWWVVEVEMAHHPFQGHVLPQVEALASAAYGDTEAAYLAARDRRLDLARLQDMMLGEPPRVLVIVNEPCPTWESDLKYFGASVLVVAVHRSDNGRAALVVEGAYPTVSEEEMSVCRRDPVLRTAFIIESPAALPVKDNALVRITYHERVTTWKRVNASDRSWLMPVSPRDSLDSDIARIEVIRVNGDTLEFREIKRRRL